MEKDEEDRGFKTDANVNANAVHFASGSEVEGESLTMTSSRGLETIREAINSKDILLVDEREAARSQGRL